jgi:diguanylate cyclase (GGDEF)-like protein
MMPLPGEAFEMTSQPGEARELHSSAEDSLLDLLVETLEGLDKSVRGRLLEQFFRIIAQIDLSETQRNEYWERILRRRRELSDHLGKRVSVRNVIGDVLASADFSRVPILVEYDEFKKLQINAATDALTGLYNRRFFDESCEKELNRAKRYLQHLAVVILDLQGLKKVNDRHGHLQGDQVLQLAATTLRKTLRASDFAFRIGGDEFALLLPQTEPEPAITLCRRLRTQFEGEVRPLKLDTLVTLDFGAAVHPQDGDQKSQLMDVADKRLYASRGTPLGAATLRLMPVEWHAPPEVPSPEASRAPSPSLRPEHRKWERVSFLGTQARAILSDVRRMSAKVIDLSYGGVALLVEDGEDIPSQFNAILQVPILPPVQVMLRRAYTQRSEEGGARIGCSFVS